MYPQTKNELSRPRLSKVIVLHTYQTYGTDGRTDAQADATETRPITTPLRGW